MAHAAEAEPPLDSLLNFRDVGKFVNQHSQKRVLKPGLFFRSARPGISTNPLAPSPRASDRFLPDEASTRDRQRLRDDYNIKTIVDLRTKSEHLQQINKMRTASMPSAAPLTPSNPQTTVPLKIPGISYVSINLNGPAYSFSLIRQLPYRSTLRLATLMTFGYRTDAISILGKNVMTPRGLSGLAIDTLTHSTSEFLSIFRLLSNPLAYPVLVHCTQGKDRTGLTVLLVLLLLKIPMPVIEADYKLSQRELLPEREDKIREVRSIGLPDSFADCPDDWVSTVTTWIEETYGSVEAYLKGIGVGEEMQESIRAALLEPEGANIDPTA